MFNCNICGSTIGGFGPDDWTGLGRKWVNNCRAVYIERLNYLDPSLSGIGSMQHPYDLVRLPRQTDISILDESGRPRDIDQVRIELAGLNPIILPNGSPHPTATATGFLFHENCFRLLEWACYPEPINVRILNFILRSFGTVPSNELVNFGHTYESLYISNDQNNRTIHMRSYLDHPSGTAMHQKNPFFEETFLELLRAAEQHTRLERTLKSVERMLEDAHPVKVTTRNITNDCFGQLPSELLDLILAYLPSKDVLNARISSRVLAAVPLSQSFWRSRFAPGNEFDYIIEPWLYKAKLIDDDLFSNAKTVYDVVKGDCISGSTSVANRKRIWKLIQPLSNALASFSMHERSSRSLEPCGRVIASLWQPEGEEEDTLRWDCVHGELLDSQLQPFHFGCRPLFKRSLALSSTVIAVKVSVLPFHDTTYITGLRFIYKDGATTSIGYILEDREIAIDTRGGLRGFRVATTERGIHALALITNSGKMSDMVGEKADCRERRLGLGNQFSAVKAYFDGMKMVYLAVPDYIHNATGPYSIWKQAREYVTMSKIRERTVYI